MSFIYDFFHPDKVMLRDKAKYESQFKKPYAERTDCEKIVVNALEHLEFVGNPDRRYYGAIEAILIVEKRLAPGSSIENLKKEGESYNKLVIRLAKDYLKEKGIL